MRSRTRACGHMPSQDVERRSMSAVRQTELQRRHPAQPMLSFVREGDSSMLRLRMPFVRLAVAAAIVLIAPVAHAVPLRGGGSPPRAPSGASGARESHGRIFTEGTTDAHGA